MIERTHKINRNLTPLYEWSTPMTCDAFAVMTVVIKAVQTDAHVTILPHASLPVYCQKDLVRTHEHRRRQFRSHLLHRWCHSCSVLARLEGWDDLKEGRRKDALWSATHFLVADHNTFVSTSAIELSVKFSKQQDLPEIPQRTYI